MDDFELPTANSCGLPTADGPLRRPTAIDRAAAAFEVILCSGFPTQIVVIAGLALLGMHPRLADGRLSPPFVFTLTLADTILLLGLIAFFFRTRGESLREQLLGVPPSPLRGRGGVSREIWFGLLLVPASFALVIFILLLLQIWMPSLRNIPHNPLADLVRTKLDAVLFAFVVMVAGGVREEIQRGFVLRRFEQYLGGGAAGLLLFSLVFGLGHLEQGRDVAIATAILGAFWGAIFLRRRSIVAPMIGHAGFNLSQVAKFVILGA